MNLALFILTRLTPFVHAMMDRVTLLSEIRLLGRQETLAEIDAALRELEAARQIVALSNADAPGGYRYQITDMGRSRLAAAGLL